MFKRMSIKKRMWMIVGLVVLIFGNMGTFSWVALKASKNGASERAGSLVADGQKDKIKVATHSMASALGDLLKDVPTDSEKVELIRQAVDKIRFEGDKSGYYFVYKGTTNVALPPKKEAQGKDLGETKDKNGVLFVKQLSHEASRGGGFVHYVFPKPGQGDQPKLGYAEMIPGTDMWIGTGVYLDNVESIRQRIQKEIEADVKKWQVAMYSLGGLIFLAIVGVILLVARSIVKPLRMISREMDTGAANVSAAAGHISASSQTLAEGASEQAAAIEETSSSLEEMSSMTKQNADNAYQADNLMKQANRAVGEASGSMSALTRSMQDIINASEETSHIIKTIDEIAFQTNLLALNAAVEAARAGESGAGFAVVADEVRNLAMRAADAARSTAGLIEGTLKKVKEGGELLDRTNLAFNEVADNAAKVGGLVGEIAAASKEQSQGIDQINRAVSEMDKVVQQNAATAEESASGAEEMNAQAEQMKSIVQDLLAIVEGRAGKPNITRQTAAKPSAPNRTGMEYTDGNCIMRAAKKVTRNGSGKGVPGPGRFPENLDGNKAEFMPQEDLADF